MIKEYNNRFLKLVEEIIVITNDLSDAESAHINSALHDFDRDVQNLIKKR